MPENAASKQRCFQKVVQRNECCKTVSSREWEQVREKSASQKNVAQVMDGTINIFSNNRRLVLFSFAGFFLNLYEGKNAV